MPFKEIKSNIFYAGLNDADRVIFDELIPLENGTSYNSYLIKGSDKNAVIDTMYKPFAENYINNFTENKIDKIDYIVSNHGEQDHTGALPLMLEKFSNAVILTNARCKENIKEMLLISDEKIRAVSDGETVSLGDKTLKFMMAPGVHWPDTMFTYLEEDNMLFTCDFLGAHLTFDDIYAKNDELLYSMAKRYYAGIMMPFRTVCKKHTAWVETLKPGYILPSHGPIYNNPKFIIDAYKDWTDDTAKNLVLMPYVSMYGSTKEMVEYVSSGLKIAGIDVYIHDIVHGSLGDMTVRLVDAASIVAGAPMVLAGPHPMAINACILINALKPKTKFVSVLGSYGWGGKLAETLSALFTNIKPEFLEPVLIKGKLKPEDYAKLDAFINTIVEKHKKLGIL